LIISKTDLWFCKYVHLFINDGNADQDWFILNPTSVLCDISATINRGQVKNICPWVDSRKRKKKKSLEEKRNTHTLMFPSDHKGHNGDGEVFGHSKFHGPKNKWTKRSVKYRETNCGRRSCTWYGRFYLTIFGIHSTPGLTWILKVPAHRLVPQST
jgi:hypothetical protein